jgi:broad specificity phosphatase PhoE
MAKKEIILVRHGETMENIREVFRGRMDVELNEAGKQQAELLSPYLGSLNTDVIYSSPLKRALQTAKIIARPHHRRVHVLKELVDFHHGEWEGLTNKQVQASYPELYRRWIKTPQLVKMPQGERLSQVRKRMHHAIKKAIKYNRSILVSHRVPLKVLICALLNLSNSHFWNIKIDLAGVTTFQYDTGSKRFILVKHNDISHLRTIQKKVLADF